MDERPKPREPRLRRYLWRFVRDAMIGLGLLVVAYLIRDWVR
jgi:hypothetical protein